MLSILTMAMLTSIKNMKLSVISVIYNGSSCFWMAASVFNEVYWTKSINKWCSFKIEPNKIFYKHLKYTQYIICEIYNI